MLYCGVSRVCCALDCKKNLLPSGRSILLASVVQIGMAAIKLLWFVNLFVWGVWYDDWCYSAGA